MTVQSSTYRADYFGNGVTDTFTVPFYFFSDSHIKVIRTVIATGVEAELILNSDYTVTGAGDPTGGSIEMSVVPTSDYKISILRNLPLTQLTHYVEGDPFPAASHEAALDELTMGLQQLQEQIDRVALDGPGANTADALQARLEDAAIGANGAGMVGFDYDNTYGAGTLGKWLKDLATSVGATFLGYLAPFTGAVLRTLAQVIGDFPVSPNWFGADPTGSADSSSALQYAFDCGNTVQAGNGAIYKIQSQVTLRSGLVFNAGGATILVDDAVGNTPAIYGNGISNITIRDLNMDGSGLFDTTAGTKSHIQLVSCDNGAIDNSYFTRSRNHGVDFRSCSNCKLVNSNFYRNYGVGWTDKDGLHNSFVNIKSSYNGDTGVSVAPAGGRGGMWWRCLGNQASDCYFEGNIEYGFRLYSEAPDGTTPMKGCNINNFNFLDNGGMDFYIYNASGYISGTVINGVSIRRTVAPGFGLCMATGGLGTLLSNVSIVNEGSMGAVAMNVYAATDLLVKSFYAENFNTGVTTSSSSTISNITFDGMKFKSVGQAFGALSGDNYTIRGGHFIHGGVGATDVAIQPGSLTGVVRIESCTFDGFYRPIESGTSKLTLVANRSINTTNTSIRVFGDIGTTAISMGNDWDAGSNPTWWRSFTRQGVGSRALVWLTAAPTTETWARGDRAINASPTVGQPKSWVCTVAGTPGTWVSEGNL